MHVEQVLGDVPAGERCRCREGDRNKKNGGDGTAVQGPPQRSWLRSLFGK
jgi:hypothetical protein